VAAAELYRAFLIDVRRRFAQDHPWTLHWAFEPADSPFAEEIAADSPAFAQTGGDLGARMAAAIARAIDGGFRRVVLIGSDVPHLGVERVVEAFEMLGGGARLVLGPAEDGGYYLVGARELVPPVFGGISWGGPRVLAETLRAAGLAKLPVKVVDSSGFASYSTIALGIKYAVDHGARVINLSIAGDSASATLQNAINYAWNNNVVVVAAAGNNANTVLQYPAACEHVVAVSATEPDDSRAAFSSYGSYITLSAPGDGIWTTQRDLANPYGSWRGTSFASPIVAGVAALMASANSSLSNTQIVSLLKQTADDVGAAGYDTSFGYGRINAFRAVSAANAEPRTIGRSSPGN